MDRAVIHRLHWWILLCLPCMSSAILSIVGGASNSYKTPSALAGPGKNAQIVFDTDKLTVQGAGHMQAISKANIGASSPRRLSKRSLFRGCFRGRQDIDVSNRSSNSCQAVIHNKYVGCAPEERYTPRQGSPTQGRSPTRRTSVSGGRSASGRRSPGKRPIKFSTNLPSIDEEDFVSQPSAFSELATSSNQPPSSPGLPSRRLPSLVEDSTPPISTSRNRGTRVPFVKNSMNDDTYETEETSTDEVHKFIAEIAKPYDPQAFTFPILQKGPTHEEIEGNWVWHHN